MSQSKRNANSWLQSSFNFDEFNESFPKKKKISKEVKNEKDETKKFTHCMNILHKKQYNSNLSILLTACLPQKPSELAISKQKQQEIFKWFQQKVQEGKPSILVISGPSGCGKTEALKIIAKENNYEIVEWITPVDQIINENMERVVKQRERFEDFLLRTTRYSSVLSNNFKRLLLIKDIPNSYVEGKDDFTSLLLKYYDYGREPLVFISTETSNSKLLTMLFSQTNRNNFRIDLININAVTQVALKNVMKRVSNVLNTKAAYLLNVTQDKINEVLSNNIGDVRSALLNLIFCSLRVEHNFISECSVREETLGLLHAIGRVINPKRAEHKNSWKFIHNPDDLASCFQTQANTFMKFIHENYLNTIGYNINTAAIAVDVISLADIINSEWRDINVQKLALSYCIRGVMIANNKPVSQWNPVRKPINSEFNMQTNYATAELQWYERYINPKTEKCTDKDISIEEIED